MHKALGWVLPSLFLLTSCASALKQRCESTNWFEHGEAVAKRGQRTASDPFVLQCEKEEAKMDYPGLSQGFQKGLSEYCTPDFAYRLGKQGDFLANDMCSGGMDLQMKPRHAAGVQEYCQAGNGENAGAAGKKYNQICPKELEAAFLPEFKKGRKKYLTGYVSGKQSQVQDLESDARQLEQKRFELRDDVSRLSYTRSSLVARFGNQLQANSVASKELQEIDGRMGSLRWEIDGLERRINEIRSQQSTLREQVREAQTELSVL